MTSKPSIEDSSAKIGTQAEGTPGAHRQEGTKQPAKDLEAALTFLQDKDDTSRFVGLALLKPVLEQELSNREGLDERQKSALVQRCWDAVPVGFLDRLLKAKANDKRSKEDARPMVGLAVAVLHVFVGLLDTPSSNKRIIGRIPLLKTALHSCLPETTTQILDIFHALCMTEEGSLVLFQDGKSSESDQRPETYLFVTLLLIDVRSSIPSLQEKLHFEEYPKLSERLGRAYDLISAFIAYLIRSLESISLDDSASASPFSSPMPVDILSKLRTNISEMLSLTIEHLRDRYDCSIAGAAGLHPSARVPNDPSSSTPLPLAWDSSTGIFTDPLTLSQMRTLSLWLRDEENDTLRAEAAGVMDVLLALYQYKDNQDFRSPVLIALQGIIETSAGVEAFLQEGAWAILAANITEILPQPSSHPLGLEIVRVLLAVTESAISGSPQEEWLSVVSLATEFLPSCSELAIAVSQLVAELLTQLTRGGRKRYGKDAIRLLKTARVLLKKERVIIDEGCREGLEEVAEALERLDLESQFSK